MRLGVTKWPSSSGLHPQTQSRVKPMDQLLKASHPLRVPGLPWGLPGQEPRAKGLGVWWHLWNKPGRRLLVPREDRDLEF